MTNKELLKIASSLVNKKEVTEEVFVAGSGKEKADSIAKAVLSRAEVKEMLATKHDLYVMAFAIVGTNLAGVAVLLQIFGG